MCPRTHTACSVVLALVLVVGLAGLGTSAGSPSAVDATSHDSVPASQETEANETTEVNETTETTEASGTTETTEAPTETTDTEVTETTDTEVAGTVDTETTETTTTQTASDQTYPPGVTAEGVTNASALVAAHQESLSETGYEFTFYENTSYEAVIPEYLENASENLTDEFFYFFNDTTTVTVENGTVERGLSPARLVSNGSIQYDDYLHEYQMDTWTNESVMVSRTAFGNQLLLQRVDLVRDPGEDPFVVSRDDVNATVTKADVVNLTLNSGEFEVAKTEQVGDRTLFTLEAVEYDGYDSVYLGPENVSVYNATVVVDEQGRVHRLSLTVEGTEYERVSMRYEFELTSLGPVEVTRPGWTERLRD